VSACFAFRAKLDLPNAVIPELMLQPAQLVHRKYSAYTPSFVSTSAYHLLDAAFPKQLPEASLYLAAHNLDTEDATFLFVSSFAMRDKTIACMMERRARRGCKAFFSCACSVLSICGRPVYLALRLGARLRQPG
jgi:hypothetical protein